MLARTGRRTTRTASGIAKCRSEHVEQREFVSWFRKTYRPVRIFAIPNGEQRAKTTGARLKAEGVSAGVPDLYIPEWCVWVEMKAVGGVVSDKQADWHAYLRSIGDTVFVCYGAAAAMEDLTAFAKAKALGPALTAGG